MKNPCECGTCIPCRMDTIEAKMAKIEAIADALLGSPQTARLGHKLSLGLPAEEVVFEFYELSGRLDSLGTILDKKG